MSYNREENTQQPEGNKNQNNNKMIYSIEIKERYISGAALIIECVLIKSEEGKQQTTNVGTRWWLVVVKRETVQHFFLGIFHRFLHHLPLVNSLSSSING